MIVLVVKFKVSNLFSNLTLLSVGAIVFKNLSSRLSLNSVRGVSL